LELAAGADLFLLVVDGSQPFQGAFPEAVLARVGPHNAIVVRNKADLPPALPRFSLDITAVEVSALTGEGLDALRARIVALADAFTQRGSDGIAVNARHAEALGRARDALDSAVGMLGSNAPVELLASDLRESLSAFGEITGHVDNERMLDLLFSTFCIGK
jgi:tRNA modification GTPase